VLAYDHCHNKYINKIVQKMFSYLCFYVVLCRYNTRRRGGPNKPTVSTPASDVSKADNASTEDKIEPAAASEPQASTPKTAGRSA
jgi:hypothetical protein